MSVRNVVRNVVRTVVRTDWLVSKASTASSTVENSSTSTSAHRREALPLSPATSTRCALWRAQHRYAAPQKLGLLQKRTPTDTPNPLTIGSQISVSLCALQILFWVLHLLQGRARAPNGAHEKLQWMTKTQINDMHAQPNPKLSPHPSLSSKVLPLYGPGSLTQKSMQTHTRPSPMPALLTQPMGVCFLPCLQASFQAKQNQSAAETSGAVCNNLHIQFTSQSTPGSPYPVAYHLHGSLLHAIDQLPQACLCTRVPFV